MLPYAPTTLTSSSDGRLGARKKSGDSGELDIDYNRYLGLYYTIIDNYNNYYFGFSENPLSFNDKGNSITIGHNNSSLFPNISKSIELNYGNYKTKKPFIGHPIDVFQFELKLFYELMKTTLMLAYNFNQIDS